MSNSKRIVYLIFSKNIGLGGHYYSLKALSNSLNIDNDVSIIIIGRQFSKALEDQPIKTYFVKYRNIINSCIILKRLIAMLNYDILHSFDLPSLIILRFLMRKRKIKHIHTHCGGPNPCYFPIIKNLILFSQENYHFFKQKKNFINSNIFLIPNRVFPIKTDKQRINMLLNEFKFKYPIYLRICRIDKFYLQSMIQSINLVKRLRREGIKANLLIIGSPFDPNIVKFIKKHENNYIKIVTEQKYTVNANELIEIADFVIGTGRGFMEGAFFSKVMLVPQKNAKIPLLIDNETFKGAFKVNFSERTRYQKYSEDINFNKIIQSINDKILYNKLASFIKNKSEDYFEILSKTELYNNIYKNLNSDYLNKQKFGIIREIHKIILELYYSKLLLTTLNKIIRWIRN